MLNIDVNNPREVYLTGVAVLSEALGPVGYARFMQQVGACHGDYTKEKYEMPDMSWDELVDELQKIKDKQYKPLPTLTEF